jgi:hypothetical protein
MITPLLKKPLRNWTICLEYKTGPKIHALKAIVLPHNTHPSHSVFPERHAVR